MFWKQMFVMNDLGALWDIIFINIARQDAHIGKI